MYQYGMQGRSKVLMIIAIFAISIFVGLYILPEDKRIPSTRVQPWDNLGEQAKEIISNIAEPLEGETFKYFYSEAIFSFEKDGNLVTDQRLVSYFEDEGDIYVYAAYYPDIKGITVTYGSWREDTVVMVNFDDPEEDYGLLFAVEAKGDQEVIRYINAQLSAVNPDFVPVALPN